MNHYGIAQNAAKQFAQQFATASVMSVLVGVSLNPLQAFGQSANSASAPTTSSSAKDALPSYLQNYKPSEEVARQAEGPLRSILNAKRRYSSCA
jgi:hypothetical protein